MIREGQRGIIKTIIIIVIAIVIISYFGFDLKRIIESPQTQRNFGYVKDAVVTVWNRYLEEPVVYLWNDVFKKLIWSTSVDALKDIKNGDQTILEKNSPKAPTVDNNGNIEKTQSN